MAATYDEAMESMLSDFDQIYEEFRTGVAELQSLKSCCDVEFKKREALESALQNARSENERLMKLYTDSLRKLADKVELYAICQNLKDDLDRVIQESSQRDDEHRNAVDFLKKEYAATIEELETQIRCYHVQKVENEVTLNQLSQDLAIQRSQLVYMTIRLEEVGSEIESKCQGLKDCLAVQQEEKNELCNKLQDLEKELLISKTKLAENQRDLTSNLHVVMLKQKIMNLRKENEVLKRELMAHNEG